MFMFEMVTYSVSKHLGITITGNMYWGKCIFEISSKSSKTHCFLHTKIIIPMYHMKTMKTMTIQEGLKLNVLHGFKAPICLF